MLDERLPHYLEVQRNLEIKIAESSTSNPKGFSYVSNRKPVKSRIGPLMVVHMVPPS